LEPKRQFLNREVAAILGISQRRIIGLTEKSVVVPLKEAAGAGYKRQYDYISLLELSLYKTLSELGLTINPIKNLLWDLRSKEVIKKWVMGFSSSYVLEILFDEWKLLFEKSRKSPSFKLPTFTDWHKSLGPEERKKMLSTQWEHTKAILACSANKSGEWDSQIYFGSPEKVTADEVQTRFKSGSFICLDLMKIKSELDENIRGIDREKNRLKGSKNR
jgi:DNA-binding transcriptional MerR regulator